MNKEVQDFYDNNPYPAVMPFAQYSLPDKYFENFCINVNKPIPEKPLILIAGCGTVATQAISKLYPNAKAIYTIDISNKTLELAQKRTSSKNVHFIHADISDPELLNILPESKFDWIHCTGVLHHLSDPSSGINNLSKLLKNEGVLRVQFYSKGARTFIEWARKAFLSKNAKSKNDVKDIMLALTKFHPFRYVLSTYPESIRFSGLKDGFLHPLVKTFYANDWNQMFNCAGLEVAQWENLHYLNDMENLFSQNLLSKFNSLSIPDKITITEKLGEWRSDFKSVIVKNDSIIASQKEKIVNTDILIDSYDNISYPRHYLWNKVKEALRSLETELNKDELIKVLSNFSDKEWLPGMNGSLLRLYWWSIRDECRMLCSYKYIFNERKEILIEDFFDSDEDISIPSSDTWPWKQWDNGFFAWNWL